MSDVSARILASMFVSVPCGVVECQLYATELRVTVVERE